MWVLVGLAIFFTRVFSHDEVFSDVTPGVIPPRPQDAPRRRLTGITQEYGGEIPVAFSPPKGVRPGPLGVLLEGKAEGRHLTATVVDLAVRGHLTITAVPASGAADDDASPKADWSLTRLSPSASDGLSSLEARLLAGLFTYGHTVRMSRLDDVGLRAFGQARADLADEVVRQKWYARAPRRAGSGAGVILAGLAAGGLVAVVGFAGSGLLAGASILASSLVLARFARGRTPRTALGSAVRIQALGFKTYLATAVADQFKFEEASGIFSRYLPYAMVFGVADHWAKVFSQVARAQSPELEGALLPGLTWFAVSDAFGDALLLDSLDGNLDLMTGAFDGFGDLGAAALDGVGDVAGGLGDAVGSLLSFDGGGGGDWGGFDGGGFGGDGGGGGD